MGRVVGIMGIMGWEGTVRRGCGVAGMKLALKELGWLVQLDLVIESTIRVVKRYRVE
jgi:hypothetical protein